MTLSHFQRDPKCSTNNHAELGAILIALQYAKQNGDSSVEIRSDSQYSISAITVWSHGWRRRCRPDGIWRSSGQGKKRIVHQHVVERILRIQSSMFVSISCWFRSPTLCPRLLIFTCVATLAKTSGVTMLIPWPSRVLVWISMTFSPLELPCRLKHSL